LNLVLPGKEKRKETGRLLNSNPNIITLRISIVWSVRKWKKYLSPLRNLGRSSFWLQLRDFEAVLDSTMFESSFHQSSKFVAKVAKRILEIISNQQYALEIATWSLNDDLFFGTAVHMGRALPVSYGSYFGYLTGPNPGSRSGNIPQGVSLSTFSVIRVALLKNYEDAERDSWSGTALYIRTLKILHKRSKQVASHPRAQPLFGPDNTNVLGPLVSVVVRNHRVIPENGDSIIPPLIPAAVLRVGTGDSGIYETYKYQQSKWLIGGGSSLCTPTLSGWSSS
jgi:hypothetical protein